MSCSTLCYPECRAAPHSPVSGSCNEPCVRQCPDSKVLIRQSPFVTTLPGPILTFGAPVVRPAFEGSFGLGRLYGSEGCYRGLYGLGGLGGYWRGYGGLCRSLAHKGSFSLSPIN
uniref:Keratin n=1 Tax=Gopherus agassizii TaxID=38772 RepID=A0A452HBY8_9SAUR